MSYLLAILQNHDLNTQDLEAAQELAEGEGDYDSANDIADRIEQNAEDKAFFVPGDNCDIFPALTP